MLISVKNKMHYQLQLLLLAVSFFTRIPVSLPAKIPDEMLHQASRYFALVGLFIGLFSAVIYWLTSHVFSDNIAIILVMAANLLITGAFHEDGWADVWDGFGGGWTIEQKLNIMKDSRLGTYGAAALFVMLMLKFQSLADLAKSSVPLLVPSALVIAHTLSRVIATSLIWQMTYVSEDAKSKAKPVVQELSQVSLWLLLITGITVLFSLVYWQQAVCLVVVLLMVRWLLIRWFNQQLSGYTGDCLGAAQQLSEVVIYLSLIVLFMCSQSAFFTQPLLNFKG